VDLAGFGHGEQQQIELVQGFGQAGQEAACLPAGLRRLAGLAVDAVVVDGDDELSERRVEFGQAQPGLGGAVLGAARGVARQRRQAHLIDRVHVAFHLSPAAGLTWQGEHQPHAQVGGGLLHVPGSEIGAVVGVEHARDAADVPARLGLAPDRLPQRQGGLQRRRRAEVDRIPGNGPGIVVLDHGQPRPRRVTRRGHHPQVELGVIGLPDLVGTGCLPAVDQLEHLRVAPVALDRQGP
jgi:hypothetical protein